MKIFSGEDLFKGFDLHAWFEDYLVVSGLLALSKKSLQYIETKKAFFAGVGVLLEALKNDTEHKEDIQMFNLLADIERQVIEHFTIK